MKKAILVMTYGSPEQYTFEGIAQFFTNIRRGVRPSDEEIHHLLKNYLAIKKSPLQEITKREVELLTERVKDNYFVYFANKFSNPTIPSVIKEMEDDGIEQAICLILEPHYSFYSIMGYEKFITSEKIKFNIVNQWYNSENLVAYWTEKIGEIIKDINTNNFRVLFSAHSVPLIALDYGDPYIDQIYDNTKLIAQKLNLSKENYTNTWQSESDIGMPWIKPDVLEYIEDDKNRPEHYIFVPISFISEHIEVLYDNDIECKELCDKYNVTYHRPEMPNDSKLLIDALVETIEKHKDNDFIFLSPEKDTFNEMKPSEISKSILKDDKELKMPDFVKKLIEKKGKENVKMPKYVRKMLEKAGKLPKE